jgi:hypothetical protein
LLLALAGCATAPPAPSSLGPWHAIRARIAVVESSRAWQAMLDWRADSPEAGAMRLTHAASGTVVELQWHHEAMRLRDNRNPEWRTVPMRELAARGILIHPRELAALLLGQTPRSFRPDGADTWRLQRHGARIRVRWDAAHARLEMADLSHGRRAILIILKHD